MPTLKKNMSKIENVVLNEVGWSTNYGIPIADEENLRLQQQLDELLEKKQQKVDKLNSFKNRLNLLNKYNKELEKQYKKDNQSILQVQKTQLLTAKSGQTLLKDNCRHFRQQFQFLDREHDLVQGHLEDQKLKIVQVLSRIDCLKQRTQFQHDMLTKSDEAFRQFVQDTDTLKMYSQIDLQRIKSLQLKREQAENDFKKKENSLRILLESIRSSKLTLHRTNELFDQVSVEHEILVRRWHNALDQLYRRNDEIHQITQEISELIDRLCDAKDRKSDELNVLETQQRSNHEMDQKIQMERLNFTNCLQHFNQQIANNNQFKCQVKNSNAELSKLLTLLDQERGKLKFLEAYEFKSNEKCDNLLKCIENIDQQLSNTCDKNINTETAIKQLDDRINTEKKQMERLTKEKQQLHSSRFHYQQMIDNCRDQETLYSVKIENCNNYMISLQEKFKKADKDIDYFQGIQYSLEIKITQIQNRLSKMSRDTTTTTVEADVNDDDDELKTKLVTLEHQFADKLKLLNLLQSQKGMIEDDIRIISHQVEKDSPTLIKVTEDLKNQQLFNTGTKKQLRTSKSVYQQRQVEANLIRLQLDQLDKNLTKVNDEIYNLEKSKIEMSALMSEKIVIINTNRDILLAKRNRLLEEHTKKSFQINNLKNNVNNLTARYELIALTIGKNEHGEPLSINFIKIRNAQERCELEDHESRLKFELNGLQKEVNAMENTLQLMGSSNTHFRKSLGPINEQNEQLLKQLRDTKLKFQKRIVTVEKQVNDKHEEFDRYNRQFMMFKEEESRLQLQISETRAQITQIEKEIMVQEDKIDRTSKMYRKVTHKLNISSDQLSKFLNDLDVRVTIMKNDRALKIIKDLATRYEPIRYKLFELMTDLKIDLPQSLSLYSLSSRSVSLSSSINWITMSDGSSIKDGSNRSRLVSTKVLNL